MEKRKVWKESEYPLPHKLTRRETDSSDKETQLSNFI